METLKKIYDPFFQSNQNIGISIATRADCLHPDVIEYLACQNKEVWIELGLQSIHEKTMEACNRKHNTQVVWDTLDVLSKTKIHTCIHIMNSLPGESQSDMIETAYMVGQHHPDAIKIHMLHIIKGTKMAEKYEIHPFHLQTLEEYVDTVIKQLEVLPPDCIIERLTGDGLADALIAPDWTQKKTIVLNEIDKKMVRINTYQGRLYKDGN